MSIISVILPYAQISLSILLIIAILLQQSGAINGGALGGSDTSGSVFQTRRGFEKLLFISTIVIGLLFALSAVLTLVI